MKSKRSDYKVITDRFIPLSMHFFSDKGRGSIIEVTAREIAALNKSVQTRKKKLQKKHGRSVGYFVHLCPEISFFVTNAN